MKYPIRMLITRHHKKSSRTKRDFRYILLIYIQMENDTTLMSYIIFWARKHDKIVSKSSGDGLYIDSNIIEDIISMGFGNLCNLIFFAKSGVRA